MPIRSIADLRQWAGDAGAQDTDEDLVRAYAQQVGMDPRAVAHQLGMNAGGGKTSNRFGAAIDSYQANLSDFGSQVASKVGLPNWAAFLDERRRANELQAGLSQARAQSMGAVDSWENVHGIRDFGDYAAGLAIQSAPYMAEAATGALTMGGSLLPAAARIVGPRVAPAAARSAGAVAASYPSSVGDVLSNQREQAGQVDFGTASALGIPYSLLNAFGVEGRIARTGVGRNVIHALDQVPGVRGAAARGLSTAAITGASEAMSETGQEMLNQVGRMSVDPNEQFFSEKAQERFKESAIGGGVLGAVFGGAGGWRRSSPVNLLDTSNNVAPPAPAPEPEFVGPMPEFVGPARPEAAAAPVRESKVFDPVDQSLIDAGIRPTKKAREIYEEAQTLGLDLAADDMVPVQTALAENKYAKAKKHLADVIIARQKGGANVSNPVPAGAGAPGDGGQANPQPPGSVGPAGRVDEVPAGQPGGASAVAPAGVSLPDGAVPNGAGQPVADLSQGVPPAPTMAPMAEYTPAVVQMWEDHSPEGVSWEQLAEPQKKMWNDLLVQHATGQPMNLYKIAEQVTQEGQAPGPLDPEEVFKKVFGPRDGAIIFDKLRLGMSEEQIAQKYGLSRPMIQKIAGKTGETKRIEALEAAVRAYYGGQQPAPQVSAEASDSPWMDAISGEEAAEAGLVDFEGGDIGVRTVGGGKSAVDDPKTDADFKRVEGLLKQRTQAATPEELAEVERKLNIEIERIRKAEKKLQGEVLAEAGRVAPEEREEEVDVDAEEETEEEADEDVIEPVMAGDATKAAAAWDKVAGKIPGAPKFAQLSKEDQETFTDYGEENWTPADVRTELKRLNERFNMKRGTGWESVGPGKTVKNRRYTARELINEIKAFVRADVMNRKIRVVESAADISDFRVMTALTANPKVYGAELKGTVWLVADRIPVGKGRSAFMHEVGVHSGLERMLTPENYERLVTQLFEWAQSDANTQEATLAKKAFARVENAKTEDDQLGSEMMAYFVEEAVDAGVEPTAMQRGPLYEWFRTLWAAFKAAMRKLGVKPETLTTQDLVDLAYGAARLEVAGKWHGTAATFRQFRNKHMGSGEGAQVYGWGTYMAQRPGIAHTYFKQDVDRKSGATNWQVRDIQKRMKDSPKQAKELRALADAVRKNVDKFTSLMNFRLTNGTRVRPTVFKVVGALAATKYTMNYHQELLDAVELIAGATRYERIKHSFQGGEPYIDEDVTKALDQIFAKPVDGNLMRVDTAVPEQHMLDWDEKLADQSPYVRARLLRLIKSAAELHKDNWRSTEFEQRYDKSNWIYATGMDLYAELTSLEDNNPEAASWLLNQAGIKGVKHRDAASRGSSTIKEIEMEKYVGTYEHPFSDKKMMVRVTPDSSVRPARRGAQIEVTHEDGASEWLPVVELFDNGDQASSEIRGALDRDRTNNHIIFDDKNIERVASMPGADPNRIKFGVSAATVQKNIEKLPKPLQRPVDGIYHSLARWSRKGLDRIIFTEDLLERAAKAGLSSARKFQRLLEERHAKAIEREIEVEKILELYNRVPDKERGKGEGTVNDFLFESTRSGKWGFRPDWLSDNNVKVDEATKGQFERLSASSQEFIKAVFRHGDKMMALKKRTALENTTTEFDALIKAAKDKGDTKAADDLTKEKIASLKQFSTLFGLQEGKPYAPIKRFGPYVLVAKSDELLKAEARRDEKRKAGDKTKDEGPSLDKLQADDRHYHVSFPETEAEARALEQELKAEGFTNIVYREREAEDTDRDLLGALIKLKTKVGAADLDEKVEGSVRHLVTQMYLQALAESSARKSEMRRRGVSGDIDMLRSFAQQGRADAQFLASLQFSEPTLEAVRAMRRERDAGTEQNRKSELFNEIMARYRQTLEFKPSPVASGLNRLTSIFFLATSPAYYFQNMTQPWMLSLPIMAGRHDYTAVASQLTRASEEVGHIFTTLDKAVDLNKLPADVREGVKVLLNRGLIDIGISSEMGSWEIDSDKKVAQAWNAADRSLKIGMQKVETFNRLATATAAYRLELKRTGNAEAAIEYAARILSETHGNYSGFNAPRAFNTSLGKVMLQFRKFQLIQLTLLAKLFKGAFTGNREMQKALAFTLAHLAVFTGAMGLPGYAAISFLLGKLLGDDDEPFNLEQALRRAVGDDDIANLVTRGLPAFFSADLSGKIGMGNALSVLPFSDANILDRRGAAETLGTLLGGPAGSLGFRAMDGLGLIANGDYYKGLELMVPKGIADASKAIRYSTEGVTRRNGDVVLDSDEISAFEAMLQAVGVTPTQVAVRASKQQLAKDTEDKLNAKAKNVKNTYARAAKERDTQGMIDARAAWMELQDAREKQGFKRSPMSDLLRVEKDQAKRERNVSGGVQFNRNNRRFVESLE